ncbi:NAD-dependent epimerase/dehydratase family protein [Yinghuangia seranimata]|uniref:NAD-dependent epimerase/dehydratase family protein n=1 Tax=Yinghuangia seranimata TaxID=408067 RepID=UPI00248C53F1|nr:NAD-dependent epimerase/dehydratase family protein [Yinghuangia seranimata]MDI2127690.1 NAD-dependent epimerase/dehydratase family protein [Yinghuangia seranimata]
MKVLVLGSTGYIGTAVTRRLTQDGHTVVPFLKTGTTLPPEPGLDVRLGNLTDPDSLRAAVTDDIDAVVNLATPTGDEHADTAAIDALTQPLRGTGRALVYTSGIWVLGATGDNTATEDTPTDPIDIVGYRPRIEQQVLDAARDDVRTAVIRPGIAYGHGGGIPALMLNWAKENGTGRYVGTPDTRWPMVHIDDLAALYTLVLTKADPGTLWHGIAHTAVGTPALAAAADLAAGGTGRAEPWPLAQAAETLGLPFAQALALDQTISGDRAADLLGWQPTQAHPTTDLTAGSYA